MNPLASNSSLVVISRAAARRFLLKHQRLLPPRSLAGKAGITDYFGQVGCLQFDPINVVGRNPDLVLQSRVKSYRPALLEELLYHDRVLLDGWDKVQSIYPTTDRPYFYRFRAAMQASHSKPDDPATLIAPQVLETIRSSGPLSSIDFKDSGSIQWTWGQDVPLARAAIERLYWKGDLEVHHRINTRRIFDLAENLLPPEIYNAPDPFERDEDYHDWHVLRRIGGLGLARNGAGEHWLGIQGVKSQERSAAIERLLGRGDLAALRIDELPGRLFYIRTQDLPDLESAEKRRINKPTAAFIAPLDNLLWDRELVRLLFDFDYTWEVYKPAAQRKYGYYVLPVLYGDRFAGRFDPAFDKKSGVLTILNWWWEGSFWVDDRTEETLTDCLRQFMDYLGARGLVLGEQILEDPKFRWLGQFEYP